MLPHYKKNLLTPMAKLWLALFSESMHTTGGGGRPGFSDLRALHVLTLNPLGPNRLITRDADD